MAHEERLEKLEEEGQHALEMAQEAHAAPAEGAASAQGLNPVDRPLRRDPEDALEHVGAWGNLASSRAPVTRIGEMSCNGFADVVMTNWSNDPKATLPDRRNPLIWVRIPVLPPVVFPAFAGFFSCFSLNWVHC